MSTVPSCPCGHVAADGRPPATCPACGRNPAPVAPLVIPGRKAPPIRIGPRSGDDVLHRLASNHQGSLGHRRPWLVRFGAGTVVGVLMMLGAVAWFSVGVLGGVFFFGSPILFGLGVLACIRDVFGFDD